MTTITGLTAERMLEIEAASVVDGDVAGNDLFLTRHDGTIINAGNVRGPAGPTGPMGAALSVLSDIPVLEIGSAGQIRAGRQLSPSDFTAMGLSAPLGLWNLSNVNDSSGNTRNLSNKGAVPFVSGINGSAATAAQFVGSTGQVLYIPDTGAADPFRIKTGSFGAWFRTAKRTVAQTIMSKFDDTVAGRRAWALSVNADKASLAVSADGAAGTLVGLGGTSDIGDDKWHFLVATVDGSKIRVYVDGVLEGTATFQNLLFGTPAPFNIGGYNGDASAVATQPHYGRVDEAFVTDDVLSLEQIRNLMAASVPHALAVLPTDVRLAVRRRRRGAAVPVSAFPAQPLRLHNFVAGALTDQGSQNIPLAVTSGTSIDSAAPDGTKTGAKMNTTATNLRSSDAGLPSALLPRSFGCWFKTNTAGNMQIMSWGTGVLAMMRTNVSGQLGSDSGADLLGFITVVSDGLWHHGVVVEDNAAADGVKRKLYLDGKVNAGSTVMNSVTLAGATGFGVGPGWGGQVSRAFVYSGALTSDQVRAIYNVGSQALWPKLRDSADYIETNEVSRLLGIFNAVEGSDTIDLQVMA